MTTFSMKKTAGMTTEELELEARRLRVKRQRKTFEAVEKRLAKARDYGDDEHDGAGDVLWATARWLMAGHGMTEDGFAELARRAYRDQRDEHHASLDDAFAPDDCEGEEAGA